MKKGYREIKGTENIRKVDHASQDKLLSLSNNVRPLYQWLMVNYAPFMSRKSSRERAKAFVAPRRTQLLFSTNKTDLPDFYHVSTCHSFFTDLIESLKGILSFFFFFLIQHRSSIVLNQLDRIFETGFVTKII